MLNPQLGLGSKMLWLHVKTWGYPSNKAKKGFRCVDASFNTETLTYLCGVPVHYIPQCSFTNTIARQYALIPAKQSIVVVTDFQTEGRGRLQRDWYSNRGENLLFSMIFRPRISAQMAPRCTLLWAAAIAQELICWSNGQTISSQQKVER